MKVKIHLLGEAVQKWWCHGMRAENAFEEGIASGNRSVMARSGGWVEAVLERLKDAAHETGPSVELDIDQDETRALLTRGAQIVVDWKAACSDGVAFDEMVEKGRALFSVFNELMSHFPQEWAPTGQETNKP